MNLNIFNKATAEYLGIFNDQIRVENRFVGGRSLVRIVGNFRYRIPTDEFQSDGVSRPAEVEVRDAAETLAQLFDKVSNLAVNNLIYVFSVTETQHK
jgi:hypothetical protein